MAINLSEAAAAYGRNAQGLGSPLATKDKADGPDFAAMLRDAAEGAVETLRQGETATLEAAAGSADLNEVIMAVSKADMTLQTVVTVRDRVIQAYQDVLRMPI